jgi:hypothetical protein
MTESDSALWKRIGYIVQEEHRPFVYTWYGLGFEISCRYDCHNGNSIVKAEQCKKEDDTSS